MKFIKPRRIPEANIQAEIYKRLQANGIESMLEYRIPEFKLRADVIVIKNETIICACEVKSRITERPMNFGKQFQKYQKLGIPFFYCLNESEIEITVNRISALWNKI